jgi:TRAP-type C4-dicarboxylate transport system permease small subunit
MLAKFENTLMAALAVASLALVSTEVVLRYYFPRYLTDYGMEFTIYFTVWALFIAGAPLVREGRHVRADIVLLMLPAWLQRALEIVALLVGLTFVTALSWYGWQMVLSSIDLGEKSESSAKFPLWIYYMSLPFGTTLMIPPFLYRLYLYIFRFDPKTMLVTADHVVRDK